MSRVAEIRTSAGISVEWQVIFPPLNPTALYPNTALLPSLTSLST